jgi:hypothetical protein
MMKVLAGAVPAGEDRMGRLHRQLTLRQRRARVRGHVGFLYGVRYGARVLTGGGQRAAHVEHDASIGRGEWMAVVTDLTTGSCVISFHGPLYRDVVRHAAEWVA